MEVRHEAGGTRTYRTLKKGGLLLGQRPRTRGRMRGGGCGDPPRAHGCRPGDAERLRSAHENAMRHDDWEAVAMAWDDVLTVLQFVGARRSSEPKPSVLSQECV